MADTRSYVFRLNDHGQGPELIQQVFLERGWREFDEDEMSESDWNFWWRTSRFRNSDYEQIYPWQRLNHYPKTTAITKKDSLARNLKRMKGVYGAGVYNFSPIAFNLPNDYTKFVADYTKLKEKAPDKTLYWICKPADLSRGRGIFIFRDLSELQYDCNAVVQQYITRPMLISGYKFDLRIYVLVPSFHPLSIYVYQEGLVRFSTEKYDLAHLGNMFAHLTNTSINKHSPSYADDKERVGPGCKWTLTQLRYFFHQTNIDDSVLWTKIINIVILTLIIQASQVAKVANCFELYGFDVMIDEKLKPWLLEVNFSPALSSDCQTDLVVKKPMLHDLIDIMGFVASDTDRGGAEFAGRQARLDRGFPTLLGGHYSGRGGRKSAASRQKTTAHHHKRKYHAGKLPDIASPGSQAPTYSQRRHRFNQAQTRQESFEGEGEDGIVPIIPGCGLPSVQQPQPRPNSNSSSGRSSAASNGSGGDGGGGDGGGGGKMTAKRKDGGSATAHSLTNRSTKSHPSLVRTSSGQSWKFSTTGDSRPSSLRIAKRDSKGSMNSDSAFSSFSGSSDNSDVLPLSDESGTAAAAFGNKKPADIQQMSAQKASRERLFSSSPQRARQTKNRTHPPGALPNGKSAAAKINSVINYEMEAKSGVTISAPGVGGGHRPPRHTASNPGPGATRRSMPSNASKRYTPMSFTANPLHTKSVMLNRRGSGTGPAPAAGSQNRGYATPWLRTKSTPASSSAAAVERSGLSPTEPRYGSFCLAFPFNEALRRCANGSLDARVVIRECQKLVKERAAQAQEEKSSKRRSGVVEAKSPKKKEPAVSELPAIWGPCTEEVPACI